MLGLGLIGGSIARAAVTAGFDVRAWTPAGDGPRHAEADGIRRAATLAEAVERVRTLIAACGAEPVTMGAAEHDRAVAAVSHLPLVVAAALAETLEGSADRTAAQGLAAGGWASATRVGRGDVEMGTGILATNAMAVADRLRALRGVLDAWQANLDGRDEGAIRERLAAARRVLAAPGSDDGGAAG
jgi:prephenate dehydrogenase